MRLSALQASSHLRKQVQNQFTHRIAGTTDHQVILVVLFCHSAGPKNLDIDLGLWYSQVDIAGSVGGLHAARTSC